MISNAAVAIVTVASTIASRTMGAKRSTWNSRPAEAMMSPPAERPTKNMKLMM